MHALAGNRNTQQIFYLIVFPLIVAGGFTIPKLIGYSDLVIVASGFLSAFLTISAFYFALHWRNPPLGPKDLPKPSWLLLQAIDSGVSAKSADALGFRLMKRRIVKGEERHWFFREEQTQEGLWRQEFELVNQKLCANHIRFSSSVTMFGDMGWQFGTGYFLKPWVQVDP